MLPSQMATMARGAAARVAKQLFSPRHTPRVLSKQDILNKFTTFSTKQQIPTNLQHARFTTYLQNTTEHKLKRDAPLFNHIFSTVRTTLRPTTHPTRRAFHTTKPMRDAGNNANNPIVNNMKVPPSYKPSGIPAARGYTIQPTILQHASPIVGGGGLGGGGGSRFASMFRGGGGGFGGKGGRGLLGSVLFSVTVLLITWTIFDALSGSGGGGLAGDIMGRKHKQAVTGDIPDRISDVIGVDDVLDQVKELVEFLQQPEKYREMGAQVPRGVLLTGPPGTGKTLIARAIAGEAGVNFLWCSAADFDEIYVGTGSRRVRDLFQDARSKAPCIIFIDEIDALGKRNSVQGNSTRNTINSILVEMDGFSPSDNVMVMAATNFPDSLDEALVRPGRFDYQLALRAPDYEGRIKLFQHYINKIKHDGKIDAERLASAIMGATGADIKTIVNNAAVRAAARNAKTVSHEDVEEAQEQFVMGVKITTKAIDLAAATRTAYHEAGHALLAILMPGSDPIFKATILPRGQALGHVAYAGSDKLSVTRTELESRLVMAMGGRAAEELIFGEEEVSTGCSSDLEQANRIANGMIKNYGYGGRTGKVVIGKETGGDLRTRADKEVEDVINTAYATAKQLLTEHNVEHERLSRALLKYEMLTADDIQKVIKGEDLPHRIAKDVEPVMNITQPGKYSLFKPNHHNAGVKLVVEGRPVLLTPDPKDEKKKNKKKNKKNYNDDDEEERDTSGEISVDVDAEDEREDDL